MTKLKFQFPDSYKLNINNFGEKLYFKMNYNVQMRISKVFPIPKCKRFLLGPSSYIKHEIEDLGL